MKRLFSLLTVGSLIAILVAFALAQVPVSLVRGKVILGATQAQSSASPSFVNVRQSASNNNTASLAFPMNVTTGDLIVICVTGQSTLTTSIADSQTNTYTTMASLNNGGGGQIFMAYTKATASGGLTITETGMGDPAIFIVEIVPPSGFAGTVDANTTNGTGATLSLTTTGGNDLVFYGLGAFANINCCLLTVPPVNNIMFLPLTAGNNGAEFGWYLASGVGLWSATIYGATSGIAANSAYAMAALK